jgi:hypothetical protein
MQQTNVDLFRESCRNEDDTTDEDEKAKTVEEEEEAEEAEADINPVSAAQTLAGLARKDETSNVEIGHQAVETASNEDVNSDESSPFPMLFMMPPPRLPLLPPTIFMKPPTRPTSNLMML